MLLCAEAVSAGPRTDGNSMATPVALLGSASFKMEHSSSSSKFMASGALQEADRGDSSDWSRNTDRQSRELLKNDSLSKYD